MQNKTPEIAYRYWQDRATAFYISARHLYLEHIQKGKLFGEAGCFCAFQAIENILKGTREYYNDGYDGNHDLDHHLKRLEALGIKINIPPYFYDYQSVPRYPESGKNNSRGSGLCIPAEFLEDLDRIMFETISQVADKGDSKLKTLLKKREEDALEISENNTFYPKLKALYN